MTPDEALDIMEQKNVFLTGDITIEDMEFGNPERYEFARSELNPDDYNGFEFENEGGEKEGSEEYKEARRLAFELWAEENLENDELYEVPVMNALRYFPSCVSFDEDDQRKTAGATTLLYDNELELWAVGMTGGGMDLSPHLLDTFIRLGKGAPIELAEGIQLNYAAYVNSARHSRNCRMLAKAFRNKAEQFVGAAESLEKKD